MVRGWGGGWGGKGLATLGRGGAWVGRGCCMAVYSAWTLGGTMGGSSNADLRPQGICMNSLESPLPQMVRAPATTKMTVQAWRKNHWRGGAGGALERRLRDKSRRRSAGGEQGGW